MKKIIVLLSALLLTMNLSSQTNPINIIPKPQEVKTLEGNFLINSSTKILCDERTRSIAEYIANEINGVSGLKMKVEISPNRSEDNVIDLQLTKLDHSNSKEAYCLNITKDKILITANELNGMFYGIQSLRQLLPAEKKPAIKNELLIPAVDIVDYPRFVYRGLNLVCCRHII